MKNLVFTLFAAVLFLTVPQASFGQEEKKGTVTLSGAWAIYPTAIAWGEGFQKKYPGIKVDISAGGAGKGAADVIAGLVDIGMISREPDPAEVKKGITPIYILHDAVFPVVSEKNPVLLELIKKGVKKESFAGLYVSGLVTAWDELAEKSVNKKLHVFTRSDSCGAAASWAKFLGKKQEDLRGVGIYGDPGILEAVRRDPLGVGYSNFSYVFTREGTVLKGIKVLPIDANGNGQADPEETLDSREAAIKAIETGKYPASRKNFFFVKGKPSGLVKEFILYALSDEGTKIVNDTGSSLPVLQSEREKVLKEME